MLIVVAAGLGQGWWLNGNRFFTSSAALGVFINGFLVDCVGPGNFMAQVLNGSST